MPESATDHPGRAHSQQAQEHSQLEQTWSEPDQTIACHKPEAGGQSRLQRIAEIPILSSADQQSCLNQPRADLANPHLTAPTYQLYRGSNPVCRRPGNFPVEHCPAVGCPPNCA